MNPNRCISDDVELGDSPIRAKGHFILVKPYVRPKKVGNVLIADDTRDEDTHHSLIAEVIDIGPTAYTDPKFCGGVAWCQVGEWVVIPRVAGCRISRGEEMFRLVTEDSICAVVKDPSEWQIRVSNTKF